MFEKVYNSAEQKAAASGKGSIFQRAAKTSIVYSRALDTPRGPSPWLRLQHKVADVLVLHRLRNALGGQARWAVSGGAPLGERLGHFYRGLGLNVLEGYGLTETTAPATVNRPGRGTKIGSVGLPLPGSGVRIAADGEIEVKGVQVFRGYHNNDAATAESLHDGWFRTGDLGSLDDEGYLRITGRKKEIIVTAGGKNVAPAVLEDRLRAHPLISQVVVVGDQRPFIGALVTLDPEGVPGWLAAHGKPEMTLAEAATDADVLASLDKAVEKANKAVSRAESVRKYRILDTDLTIANGFLTPKLSIRRNEVLKAFAGEVDALYDGPRARLSGSHRAHQAQGRDETRRREHADGVLLRGIELDRPCRRPVRAGAGAAARTGIVRNVTTQSAHAVARWVQVSQSMIMSRTLAGPTDSPTDAVRGAGAARRACSTAPPRRRPPRRRARPPGRW